VDLGKEATFDRAVIEERGDRVVSFKLQIKKGDDWETFYSGQKIGKGCEIRFPVVIGRYVRLNIIDATANPSIAEFHLFSKRRDP
jgi:hypothetical protein